MATSVSIVAYLGLFAGVGIVFLFVNLLVGWLVRPSNPHAEKAEIYECGEPTIGSSFVQFDLRFYVVALLFIIFDVELAFFFPWATVLGKSVNLADPRLEVVSASGELTPAAHGLYRELGIENTATGIVPAGTELTAEVVRSDATTLTWVAIFDIAVFFAVLMVGFAYVWKRGDLDWVRSVAAEPKHQLRGSPGAKPAEEPVLSA